MWEVWESTRQNLWGGDALQKGRVASSRRNDALPPYLLASRMKGHHSRPLPLSRFSLTS